MDDVADKVDNDRKPKDQGDAGHQQDVVADKAKDRKPKDQGDAGHQQDVVADKAKDRKPKDHGDAGSQQDVVADKAKDRKPKDHGDAGSQQDDVADKANDRKPKDHGDAGIQKDVVADKAKDSKPKDHGDAGRQQDDVADKANDRKPKDHGDAGIQKDVVADKAKDSKPKDHGDAGSQQNDVADKANDRKPKDHGDAGSQQDDVADKAKDRKPKDHGDAGIEHDDDVDKANDRKPKDHGDAGIEHDDDVDKANDRKRKERGESGIEKDVVADKANDRKPYKQHSGAEIETDGVAAKVNNDSKPKDQNDKDTNGHRKSKDQIENNNTNERTDQGAKPGSKSLKPEGFKRESAALKTKDKLLEKLPCCKPKKKDDESSAKSMSNLKKEIQMDEHMIPLDELFERLKTNPDKGMSEQQVLTVRQEKGFNEITPPEKSPEWVKFMKLTFHGFGILLFLGGILCMICFGVDKATNEFASNDNAWVAVTIFLVVFLSGALSYYQDRSSSKIMESFKNMVPPQCRVWRDGVKREIPSRELVVGDICEIKGGDKIPADIRILEANSLKVDNSSLTGESEPQSRRVDYINENPLEAANLIFYSTFAVEGGGKGIVVKTGDGTIMGRIATLAIGLDVGQTPIAIEINHFIRIISQVAITYGIIVFVITISFNYAFVSALLLFIGCVIGNVPEGLLIEVTILFALTAKRMASKNCLVRKLQAVETLGSTSVICSDKTGTLTQNRMTVAHTWNNGQIRDADMSQDHFTFRSKEDMQGLNLDKDFMTLAQCAALCNRAEFKPGTKEMPVLRRDCLGDASETALLKYVQIAIGNVVDWRARNPKIVEIPFNSTNKYQVSVHVLENKTKGNYIVVMKGAPERILERCNTYLADGEERQIDDDFKEQFNGAYFTMGSLGERVLGFCDCVLQNDKYPHEFDFQTEPPNFPVEGMRFLGLMSMIDPPRPGVPDAVAKCRSAGIKVTMVTGDHPITAKAIAKSVGIFTEGNETVEDIAERLKCRVEDVDPEDADAIVIHGAQLKDMTVDELAHVLSHYEEIVFARTSPQQKLIIVEGYQKLGKYVAVTGDGVNDSPALKQADIGIAMGIAGSDVSKQAADMILMDDNFASIVTGVEEGRLIFDNLKKALCYVLITNIPEIMPFMLLIPCGIPLAINTVTILCICLGTDIWPAISLAYEQAESDIMKRAPRDPQTQKLVSSRNWWLNSGLIFETALCAFLLYTPGFDEGLRLYGIRFWWWWPALPFAVYVFCYDELRKFMLRRAKPDSFVADEFGF